MLIFNSFSSFSSSIMSFMKIENNVGDELSPCFTPDNFDFHLCKDHLVGQGLLYKK